MNKQLLTIICILTLVGLAIGVGVEGADTATVTATVTPGEISVSLSRTTTTYGTMLLNSSKSDPQGAITATAGTAEIDLNFTGADATYNIGGGGCGGDGVCTWTLTDDGSIPPNPAPGTDSYSHTATIDTTETALTTSAQTLVQNLAAGASKDFTLKMYTPVTGSTETAAGNQYSTTVTVTAISSL